MTIEKYRPTRQDVIRIDTIDTPTKVEQGEGIFRWRHGTADYYLDILGLRSELRLAKVPRMGFVMDYVQNFKKVYINLRTGEVSS